jgi:hypothetical protein
MFLSFAILYSGDDKVINEYGAVGGMRIGRGNPKCSEKTCPDPTLPTTT